MEAATSRRPRSTAAGVRARTAASAVGLIALLSGCFGSTGTAEPTPSSAAHSVHHLRVVHVDSDYTLDPTTSWFADALAQRSGGLLEANFAFDCCGDGPDIEQQAIHDVASGAVDLGWVGVRALHKAGTSAFDPLIAPMVIGSYQGMKDALADEDVTRGMLASLEPVGVTGLGVVPGSIRFPLSTGVTLTDPARWAGLPFYSFESVVGTQSLAALGVTAQNLGFGDRDEAFEAGRLKAQDNSLLYQSTHTEQVQQAVVNVPLWARISVVIASPQLALSDEEKAWIAGAVADTVARTPELADLDRDAVEMGCRASSVFVTSTAAQLAEFRQRFAPVVDAIGRETGNEQALERVRSAAGQGAVEDGSLGCAGTGTPSSTHGG
ncbi:TRAP transporter substrate-binding protein [Cellulomonas alba]|uniref:TRAP-type C4-dicarboxylate transport system, substrate-binding protein n=1 Tax=Cellulomonas alba TaxID=3053467 RepID=A0ABT7SG97_9CELL|nr:hypothetical protein [Cellulomonas alba]MDM7854534.1 hypothetical protein [Cellulomonas alba]